MAPYIIERSAKTKAEKAFLYTLLAINSTLLAAQQQNLSLSAPSVKQKNFRLLTSRQKSAKMASVIKSKNKTAQNGNINSR